VAALRWRRREGACSGGGGVARVALGEQHGVLLLEDQHANAKGQWNIYYVSMLGKNQIKDNNIYNQPTNQTINE
jgi:hypothetical protein